MIMLKDDLIRSGTVEDIACWRLWRHACQRWRHQSTDLSHFYRLPV